MSNLAHTEQYGGYTIEVEYDHFAGSPWDEYGCVPPILVDHGRREGVRLYEGEGTLRYYEAAPPIHALTADHIQKNYEAIAQRVSVQALIDGVNDRTTMVDVIRDELSEHYEGLSDTEKMTEYSLILDWMGVPNKLDTVIGYSQGDYATVISMLTHGWAKGTGIDVSALTEEEKDKWLTNSIDLYRWWAFGDVVSYSVYKTPVGGEDDLGDPVDSCCGFYGEAPEYGGAITAAKSYIDNITQGNTHN